MHGTHIHHIDDPGPAKTPPALGIGLLAMGVIGLVIFAVGAFTGTDESRLNAWNGFFASYLFFWFLAMGAAAWLAIQYVVGAKWFVVIKRLPESLAQFAYRGGFVFPLVGLLGTGLLYSWAQPGADYPYEGTAKAVWLSPPVHFGKVIVYTLILSAITWVLVNVSRQGAGGNAEALRGKREKISIFFLVVYTFVFSFFGWDIIMALEPKWFSTMFGVYCFTGAFNSAMALMMLLIFWMRSQYPQYVSEKRQMYDLGTYVMGFSTFWMYIAFSQFMLIWYANISDETFWYMKRYEHGWLFFTIGIPVLKWLIPFFLLMPPRFRTNVVAQTVCCSCILVGQFFDLWWMIAPVSETQAINHLAPTLVNLATFFGVFGFFGWSVVSYLGSAPVIPVEDPDLLNSVNGEYLHA